MPVQLAPGLTLGPFTLEEKIALGGMAEIWVAQERTSSGTQQVGLKILQPFFNNEPTFLEMFRDEVNIAQRLKHQNIVQVYGGSEFDGHLLQSMELVDGTDVRKLLMQLARAGTWFPAPLALLVGREVARGLYYAHNRKNDAGEPLGIVHRDISPHNVMLTRAGAVKILDFGIARAAERLTRTRTGVVKGKLAYMAPEQALAANVTPRTDIFSLGVVLWEMLAMQRLFKAKDDAAILELVIRAEIPSLRGINNVVPADADDLIRSMLAQDPKKRPANMRVVENLITRVLAKNYNADDYTSDALAAWLGVHLAAKAKAPGGRRAGQTAVLPPEDTAAPTPDIPTKQLETPSQEDLMGPAGYSDDGDTRTVVPVDTVVDTLPPDDREADKTIPVPMPNLDD